MKLFHIGIPDLVVKPQRFLVDGDLVMDHWEAEGTHTGDLFGIPPTGKALRLSGIGIARIGDRDKIVERWAQFNLMEIMQQLGMVPGGTGWPEWADVPEVVEGRSATPPTTPEENKAVMLRHIEEIWNNWNLGAADELFHPEAVAPYAPTLPPGPQGCKVIAQMFRAAFPDLHVTV
ncbi:MAG: ester cyclase, partial [Acidimicrobiales bacterium]